MLGENVRIESSFWRIVKFDVNKDGWICDNWAAFDYSGKYCVLSLIEENL